MNRDELLVLRKTLYEYLNMDFIEKSYAPGGAPVIFIKKPSGGLRFCVDYRALNVVIIRDGYPLPLIHDTLRDISASRYVLKVDVISAFHRLRIRPGDEPLTTFRTPFGAYQWKVTPFGLTNAPAAFQRYINDTLAPWLGICCSAYLDDVVIYTNGTQEDHRQKVKEIIQALAKAGLFLDWDKSEFEAETTRYLGFIVQPGKGISADPAKIQAIRDWLPPTTMKAVRSFLGFTNFYRVFIPRYSAVATPLVELTKKEQPFR